MPENNTNVIAFPVPEFNTGDRVKVTAVEQIGEHASHLKIGDTGVITGNFVSPDVFIVVFDDVAPGLRDDFAFTADQIELAVPASATVH